MDGEHDAGDDRRQTVATRRRRSRTPVDVAGDVGLRRRVAHVPPPATAAAARRRLRRRPARVLLPERGPVPLRSLIESSSWASTCPVLFVERESHVFMEHANPILH